MAAIVEMEFNGSTLPLPMDMDFTNILMMSYQLISQNRSLDIDLTKPYIRMPLRYIYPLFIFLFACVSVVGVVGNIFILFIIAKRRLYKNGTHLLLANLALSDLLKAAVIAPMTLANLLIENFIFGSFMCYFMPMMHSFPIHASMLTYTMLAVDRYRFIVHPMKSRLPTCLTILAVWVVSVCVVLPYAVYVKYIDLKPHFGQDIGLCMIDHDRHIEEYIRAMFCIFYCLPLCVITFLYVKVQGELKFQSESTTVASGPTESVYESSRDTETGDTSSSHQMTSLNVSDLRCNLSRDYDDDVLDTIKEKTTQKYIITMVMLFATCWCPVTILILVTHFVYEDDESRGRFDITYVCFSFFGYFSICINPILFAYWKMPDQTRNRLRGYFRFSNRTRNSQHTALGRVSDVTINPHIEI